MQTQHKPFLDPALLRAAHETAKNEIVNSCLSLITNLASQEIIYPENPSQPNNNDTWISFLETIILSLLITGYAFINKNEHEEYMVIYLENIYIDSNNKFYTIVKNEKKYLHNLLQIKSTRIMNNNNLSPIFIVEKVVNQYKIISKKMYEQCIKNDTSGILFLPSDYSDEDVYQIKNAVKGIKCSNNNIITIQGNTEYKWQSLIEKADYTSLLEIIKQLQRKICSVFNINPILIGITTKANDNFNSIQMSFQKHYIIPLITNIIQHLNNFLNIKDKLHIRKSYETRSIIL
jgi:hypothetical protein